MCSLPLVGCASPDCSNPTTTFSVTPATATADHLAKAPGNQAQFRPQSTTTFPAGCNPQVPVSDRLYYPVYQTCVDLDIPIVVNAGIAGPRVPSECQNVMHFDQVCYDFPELRIVMRHGAEPWEGNWR